MSRSNRPPVYGKNVRVHLPAPVASSLRRQARKEGTTVAAIVSALISSRLLERRAAVGEALSTAWVDGFHAGERAACGAPPGQD